MCCVVKCRVLSPGWCVLRFVSGASWRHVAFVYWILVFVFVVSSCASVVAFVDVHALYHARSGWVGPTASSPLLKGQGKAGNTPRLSVLCVRFAFFACQPKPNGLPFIFLALLPTCSLVDTHPLPPNIEIKDT